MQVIISDCLTGNQPGVTLYHENTKASLSVLQGPLIYHIVVVVRRGRGDQHPQPLRKRRFDCH